MSIDIQHGSSKGEEEEEEDLEHPLLPATLFLPLSRLNDDATPLKTDDLELVS